MLFDSRAAREFARDFAIVALSNFPEDVIGLTGGLPLAKAAEEHGAFAEFTELLRNAVSDQKLDWTVVLVRRWQGYGVQAGRIYVIVCPVSSLPPETIEVDGPVRDGRDFIFLSAGNIENNCTMPPSMDMDNWPARERAMHERQDQREFDQRHIEQLKLYVSALIGILGPMVNGTPSSINVLARLPHARRHFEALCAATARFDDEPPQVQRLLGKTPSLDEAMHYAAMTILALGESYAAMLTIAERRMKDMS